MLMLGRGFKRQRGKILNAKMHLIIHVVAIWKNLHIII